MYPSASTNAFNCNQHPAQLTDYGEPIPTAGTGTQPPIIAQPVQTGQAAPPTVPAGLEYLSIVGVLMVKQNVEAVECCCGCETQNKYMIMDSKGTNLYYAKEDTDCCSRNCCGKIRPFDIKIRDMGDNEVIRLSRPLACGCCIFPCCLQSVEIYAPINELAGTVEQEWNICGNPRFVVKDPHGRVVLTISGSCCTCSLCGSVEFQVLTSDGEIQVGKISKKWSGLLQEAFTDVDNFGISFPVDLDVRLKAAMLGAAMLIDFMYFEAS